MIGKLIRLMLAGLTALLALLSGCKGTGGWAEPMYGMEIPPEHPTVVLTDFSYTPASPIRVGDTLTLTVTTSEPVEQALVSVRLPSLTDRYVELADDGQPPDETAGDGIWTAERLWTEEMGNPTRGAIEAELFFLTYYRQQQLWGPDLTVSYGEEE